MSTKAISSSSSSPSTYSAPTVHNRKKSDTSPLSKKVDNVFSSFTSSNQTTLASGTTTHSTALPALPPPPPPPPLALSSDVVLQCEDTVKSQRKISDSSIPSRKIGTSFSSTTPLNLRYSPDSPPLPPPPSTLTVPLPTRNRSHSASPRSSKQQAAFTDLHLSPNQTLFTSVDFSSSSMHTSTALPLSSDSLSPTRASRQRSSSLALPSNIFASSSSLTGSTFVGTRNSYSHNKNDTDWCVLQVLFAETLIKERRFSDAEMVYEKVIEEDEKRTVQWAEPRIRIADLQSTEKARRTLNVVINKEGYDRWGKIHAFLKKMRIVGASKDYESLKTAYKCWERAKSLIEKDMDSMRKESYLGFYGQEAEAIRIRKEAIEGASSEA